MNVPPRDTCLRFVPQHTGALLDGPHRPTVALHPHGLVPRLPLVPDFSCRARTMAESHDVIERILRVAFPTLENNSDIRALAERLAGNNPFILPFYVSHFDSLDALIDP